MIYAAPGGYQWLPQYTTVAKVKAEASFTCLLVFWNFWTLAPRVKEMRSRSNMVEVLLTRALDKKDQP